MPKRKRYDCDQIRVLETHEVIRLRPGMYIGDTDGAEGKSAILTQLVGFAAQSALAGCSARARVRVQSDGTAIVDDDVGLPFGAVERLFTTLHCGGGRGSSDAISAHLVPCVALTSALSAPLEVELHERGRIHRQIFNRGIAAPPYVTDAPDALSSACYRVALDPQIFPSPRFDADDVKTSLEDLLFFAPTLKLELFYDGRRADLRVATRGLDALDAERRAFFDAVVAHDLALVDASGDIRALALEYSRRGQRRQRHLAVRRWVARAIDHLAHGRINASVDAYARELERVHEEIDEKLLLLQLIELGSIERVAAQVDRVVEERSDEDLQEPV